MAAAPPRMSSLIPIINKLQDVFNTTGSRDVLQLPQIVVVGSQSSGKSSVLETIVGRDFLPRGSGIVTRVPLILQLTPLPATSHVTSRRSRGASAAEAPADYATFLHKPGQTYYDFEEVRKEIAAETERLTGAKQAISDQPIRLSIFSASVLNLTLVDLPGMTKNATGDQPKDIEMQIRKLIKKYIDNPNSVILAVSMANVDIANSEALNIAREVDPEGDRTIGVLTKLDLMDKGTDATDILTGQAFPLKLGHIGVVCRSQQDINSGLPIGEAIEAEQAFFARNYPTIKHKCGSAYLSKTLNKVLMHHIRACLPALKRRIKELQQQTQAALQTLGEPLLDSVDKGTILLQILTRFAHAYVASINGRSGDIHMTQELSGGAMICHIFHHTFARALESIDPLEDLSATDIRTAIRNSTGARPALFVPDAAFENLTKRQIARLEDPSLRCAELVFEEMERLIAICASSELSRFQVLKENVVEVVSSMLRERLPVANTMIESLIAIELAYINTNHPHFEGASGAIIKMLSKVAQDNGGKADEFSAFPNMKMQGTGGPLRERSNSATVMRDLEAASASGSASADEGRSSRKGEAARSVTPPLEMPERSGGMLDFLPFIGRRPVKKDVPVGSPSIMHKPTVADITSIHNTPMRAAEPEERLSSRETMEIELVRYLIQSYFQLVRTKVQDSIPKLLMHLCVTYMEEQVQNELVRRLYNKQDFERLLQEDAAVAAQRESAVDLLAKLSRGLVVLAEVADSGSEV